MKLTRPGLGIGLIPAGDGVRVMQVDSKGGAAAAGLQVGDVISEVAGKPVVDVPSLRAALKGRSPGDPVAVHARRGTSSLSRTVNLTSVAIPNVVLRGRTRKQLDAEHRRYVGAGFRPAYVIATAHGERPTTYDGLWLRDERPFLAKLEETAEAFEKQARELPAGYRLEWLRISGEADRRRTAVWVEDPDRIPWEFHPDLGRPQLAAAIDGRAAQGYRPRLIAAHRGPAGETLYSGVWIKDATPFQARVHVTAEELQKQLDTLSAGWRPEWVDVYQEHGRRFYTAIFVKDEGHAEWQLTLDTPAWGVPTLLNKMTEEGFVPVLFDLE
jgi:hypothetical protein